MAYPSTDPEVIYDLARGRLERQLGAVDAIDAKIGINFAIGSALVGIAAAVYAFNPTNGKLPLALSAGAYLALTAVCLAGLRLRDWMTGPSITEVYQDHIDYTPPVIKWRATDTLVNHYSANELKYAAKIRWARWSTRLLLAQTVVLAAVLLVVGPAPAHP